jgi:hypothetical protein
MKEKAKATGACGAGKCGWNPEDNGND